MDVVFKKVLGVLGIVVVVSAFIWYVVFIYRGMGL